MRFLNYVQEEYSYRVGDTEIYKNPTITDIKEIHKQSNQVRFAIVPSTKTVYMWDAYSKYFHWQMADRKDTEVTRENAIFGYGTIRSKVIEVFDIRFGDNHSTKFNPTAMKWIETLTLFNWSKTPL
jgi:hypothetical protein